MRTLHIYRLLWLRTCACHCHYFITCLGRALLSPSRLVYLTWINPYHFLVESGSSILIECYCSQYSLLFVHSHSCLLIARLCRVYVGSQWDNAVSLWSCVLHLPAVWQDRNTSMPVYRPWFVWHDPTSRNH